MANFEAFRWNISLSTNLFFLKSVLPFEPNTATEEFKRTCLCITDATKKLEEEKKCLDQIDPRFTGNDADFIKEYLKFPTNKKITNDAICDTEVQVAILPILPNSIQISHFKLGCLLLKSGAVELSSFI